MSCLALSLQPANGSDILLQTREWFPPARALVALSAFRQTRLAFASGKHQLAEDGDTSLGDDPLAASSGQLIVGVESRYRVVYRLVNSIYVLGITTVDQDKSVNNVFECISIVNQAVSVIVTACRGVDVTPEKLSRKYAEIYMALDIVLRGVSNIRLAAMLASMHGDSIAKMVHSAIDSENKIRGADSWANVEHHSAEQQAGVEAFSNASFELPPETLEAGDEAAATLAPTGQSTLNEQEQQQKPEEDQTEKDPFAASEALNKPEELVGGFKKDKDQSSTDLSIALAGLDVSTLPPPAATESTHIGVEGFEGDYGGIEFSHEGSTLAEDFEGMNQAWGGGLDASEFVDPKKAAKSQGLGGLELLQTGSDAPPTAPAGAGTPLENLLVEKTEMKGPEMYISEEISAEFRESLLARVGLMGVVYLRTLPPKSSGDKETEFSFKVEGTSSSLGNGMFHVRTAALEEPIPILKYSLLPRSTPLPLRVRLIKRHSGTLLSLMVQYVSNPDLPAPLTDVTITLKLPVDPSLLKVSPKAILNRSEKELKWHIEEIPLKGTPGRLRARMPVDSSEEDGGDEIEVVGYVKFSIQGTRSLSGFSLRPASEGKTDFYEVKHRTLENATYVNAIFVLIVIAYTLFRALCDELKLKQLKDCTNLLLVFLVKVVDLLDDWNLEDARVGKIREKAWMLASSHVLCFISVSNSPPYSGEGYLIDDFRPFNEPHFFHFDLPDVGTEQDERLGGKLKLLGLDMRDAPTQVVDFDTSGIFDNRQCEFVVVLDRFPNPAYTPKFEDVFQWSSGDPRTGCMVRGTETNRFVVLRRVPVSMPPQTNEYAAISRAYNNIVKNAIICYFVWECRRKSFVRAHLNCRLKYCYY
ncbi:hypothetical protein CsSME_00044083 [Camellia sinensis var. sinensis]